MSQFRAARHRLWFRLTTAFLLVALVGVVVVAMLANQATMAGFNRFLQAEEGSIWSNLAMQLGDSYAQAGDWREAEALLSSTVGPGRGGGGVQLTLLDQAGSTVATAGMRRGPMGQGQGPEPQSLPVNAGGRTVGTLLVSAVGMGSGRSAQQFLAEVNRVPYWFLWTNESN